MRRMFRIDTAGFTLMEVMVVIIVISVLASIVGPMIGSITDQGKATATKAQLQNIKTALVNYSSDLGNFPFVGPPGTSGDASITPIKYGGHTGIKNLTGIAQVINAPESSVEQECFGATELSNVLVSNDVPIISGSDHFCGLGLPIAVYKRRWKGPYMDSDPSDFMYDAWDSKIRYRYDNNMLWLQSFGPDGIDDFDDAISPSPTSDDIVLAIAHVK
ncbi:MAG: prepilin-type N-terminal cleavage/methylation domain-containing protein [Candidatus Riflebacteria bacterium]|nr:prepilin-type N-terminal cleavage/methylation domain-containing protein [Candidatus Riflebacteria bacterium]